MEYMFDPSPTSLGRDVGRIVGSNQESLQPEVGRSGLGSCGSEVDSSPSGCTNTEH